jgi:hypothetical protein
MGDISSPWRKRMRRDNYWRDSAHRARPNAADPNILKSRLLPYVEYAAVDFDCVAPFAPSLTGSIPGRSAGRRLRFDVSELHAKLTSQPSRQIMDDEIRKLATQLAESSRSGDSVKLEPQSVVVALSALHAYFDERSSFGADKPSEGFRIELIDDQGSFKQILAIVRDPVIARAAFAEAEKRHPGRRVVLRPGARQMSESA